MAPHASAQKSPTFPHKGPWEQHVAFRPLCEVFPMKLPRVLRRSLAVVLATASLSLGMASLGAVQPAVADPVFIGWPATLPAWAYSYVPSDQDPCRAGRDSCINTTLNRMRRDYT